MKQFKTWFARGGQPLFVDGTPPSRKEGGTNPSANRLFLETGRPRPASASTGCRDEGVPAPTKNVGAICSIGLLSGRLTAGLALMLGILGSGCVTTDNPAARMQERSDILLLQEKLTRVEGRIESFEMEYRRLLNETESLRAKSGDSGTQQRTTQARLDTMEQRIAALDAARERDRQAIVDQLSGRITEVMRTSTPAKASARTAAGAGAGYEHEVQAGETLSAIAAAYKVTVKVITEANDLKDPDHLRKGQKLFIPK